MRPGVNVTSASTPPARGLPTETGVLFAAGLADQGPANKATVVHNLGDFVRLFGDRVAYSILYDAMETFFREGGTTAYVVRVVGPAAAPSTLTLMDRAGAAAPTLRVDAIGPGTYGQTISVAVLAGAVGGEYVLQILKGGVEVERTPSLASPTDAVNWSQTSGYVRVTDLASATAAPNNAPAVAAAAPLAGGVDDRAAITDAVRTAALANFTRDLGPGQVAYFGGTTAAIHQGLRDHARVNNRTALLDMPDTATVGTMTALVAGIDEEYSATLGPWITVPGIVANTLRTVPPSSLAAGLIARSDATRSPNVPAAGANGQARWALGVTHEYTDADRETLNDAGVDIFRNVYGSVRLYGYRTNADPVSNPGWLALSNQRLRMAITNRALNIAENFQFDQIDGRGRKFSEFAGALTGMLLEYYNDGSLYGDTPDAAFAVDTGAAVNTPLTIANNELRADISLRMSPFAEMTTITIVKVGITEAV